MTKSTDRFRLLEQLLHTLQWVLGLIEAKQITIGRLQRLIFGAKTETTSHVFPQPPPAGLIVGAPPTKRKGHGRTAAANYAGFTTSLLSEVEGHRLALFITGHRHAGENLNQLLARRATDAPLPIQTCDALSRNPSKEFQTILANCLAHE